MFPVVQNMLYGTEGVLWYHTACVLWYTLDRRVHGALEHRSESDVGACVQQASMHPLPGAIPRSFLRICLWSDNNILGSEVRTPRPRHRVRASEFVRPRPCACVVMRVSVCVCVCVQQANTCVVKHMRLYTPAPSGYVCVCMSCQMPARTNFLSLSLSLSLSIYLSLSVSLSRSVPLPPSLLPSLPLSCSLSPHTHTQGSMVQWVRESMRAYMLPETALQSPDAVDFIARVSKVSCCLHLTSPHSSRTLCGRVCVFARARACVRACVNACVRACVRACVCVCVCVCV